jgi:hypothetical protein
MIFSGHAPQTAPGAALSTGRNGPSGSSTARTLNGKATTSGPGLSTSSTR